MSPSQLLSLLRWVLLLALMWGNAMAADPIAEAQTRFQALNSYRVTVRSRAQHGEQQIMLYAYRKPGWVKVDMVQPHGGAVLIYDPNTRQVRLWPFGLKLALSLSLDPDHPLLRGPHGHQIDRSDIGALLANLAKLHARGSMTSLGETAIGAQPATAWEIVGDAGVAVAGVHRYRVWLAQDTFFPLRVESWDADGGLIENVDMLDAELDTPFPEQFFTP